MEKFISKSPSDTWKIADEFFNSLKFPAVIALHGNLGAGKTCFTQGLAVAAGVKEPVCSPTYTLICEYQGKVKFNHIDLYRLSGPEEAYDIGLDEYLETDGVTIIEWAERASELISDGAIHIQLTRGKTENERIIEEIENPL